MIMTSRETPTVGGVTVTTAALPNVEESRQWRVVFHPPGDTESRTISGCWSAFGTGRAQLQFYVAEDQADQLTLTAQGFDALLAVMLEMLQHRPKEGA